MKITARWRQGRPGDENPVRDPAPLLHALAGGHPCESPPDQMHTWHHGIGREFVANCIVSLINYHARMSFPACMCTHAWFVHESEFLWWPEVLLACVCKIWGGRNIEQRLANGFASFHTWKTANKQSSSLTKFELKTFKMTSSLGGMRSHACIMPAEFCGY